MADIKDAAYSGNACRCHEIFAKISDPREQLATYETAIFYAALNERAELAMEIARLEMPLFTARELANPRSMTYNPYVNMAAGAAWSDHAGLCRAALAIYATHTASHNRSIDIEGLSRTIFGAAFRGDPRGICAMVCEFADSIGHKIERGSMIHGAACGGHIELMLRMLDDMRASAQLPNVAILISNVVISRRPDVLRAFITYADAYQMELKWNAAIVSAAVSSGANEELFAIIREEMRSRAKRADWPAILRCARNWREGEDGIARVQAWMVAA
jgi:hypothetical protein